MFSSATRCGAVSRRSGAFYDAALGALGFRRVSEDEVAIGYGVIDGQDNSSMVHRPVRRVSQPAAHDALTQKVHGEGERNEP